MAALSGISRGRNQQGQDPCRHHRQQFSRSTLNQRRLPGTPVEALQLIGKNDPEHIPTRRQRHLEGIPLHARCHGTKEGQANLGVVSLWRDHQGRSPSSLLTPCLWREGQPNQITPIRDVGSCHSKNSAPTADPVSIEAWRLASETSAKRSARLRRSGTDGLTTSSPSWARRLTSVPAPRPTSSARPRGMRTPRLFPHFWTRVRIATPRLYQDYTHAVAAARSQSLELAA